jgi:hypothetical protein
MASDSFSVVIDGSGHVLPEGRAAIRRLGARAGRYRLVPSSEGLVILERVEPAGETPRGRTVLAGDIERVGGMLDVVELIHARGWSGQLVVLDDAVRRALQFHRGELSGGTSNQPEERIGAVLYRSGRITGDDLERVLAQPPSPSSDHASATATPRFGQRLVEAGALTAHDLYRYVHQQVEEIFHAILAMRRGEYYIHRSTDDAAPPPLRLPTKQLLLDGTRRIHELSALREKVPGPDAVMARRSPSPAGKLEPRESMVLALVDGARDVAAIAQASHLGEYETTRALFQLVHGGWVQLAPRAAPERTPPSRESLETLLTLCNEGFARIHEAVAAHGRHADLFAWLDSFFEAAGEYAPLFVGALLDSDGRIGAEQLLANLEMAPVDDKVAYLQRGLRELLQFQLFAAGDIVDRDQELALREQLKPLLRDLPQPF